MYRDLVGQVLSLSWPFFCLAGVAFRADFTWVLGGSWVGISRATLLRRVTILITHIRGLTSNPTPHL